MRCLTRFAALAAALGLLSKSVITFAACPPPPYVMAKTMLTVNDPARSNRAISLELHYPAQNNTDGAPPITGCSFGLIGFGHGFTISVTAYRYLAASLVPDGYVLVLPATEGGLSPSHADFAADLVFAIYALRSNPTFAPILQSKSVLAGHSMGGGAAVLAMAGDPSIAGLFALAPAETTPSAIAAASSISRDALVMVGSQDCVTPFASHAGPIFAALATPMTNKSLLTITGGGHCGFAENSFTCALGEMSCGTPALAAAAQREATIMALKPWLVAVFASSGLFASGFE
jgi:pimeloyl-ACP methyl ester carboxylesterase